MDGPSPKSSRASFLQSVLELFDSKGHIDHSRVRKTWLILTTGISIEGFGIANLALTLAKTHKTPDNILTLQF
jgi:hypothetical protein